MNPHKHIRIAVAGLGSSMTTARLAMLFASQAKLTEAQDVLVVDAGNKDHLADAIIRAGETKQVVVLSDLAKLETPTPPKLEELTIKAFNAAEYIPLDLEKPKFPRPKNHKIPAHLKRPKR